MESDFSYLCISHPRHPRSYIVLSYFVDENRFMKNSTCLQVFVIALLSVVLMSCKGAYTGNAQLEEIDNMMASNPRDADSLLTCFKNRMAGVPEAEQMYADLLSLKADVYNYRSPQNDSLVLAVVNYYERQNDPKQLSQVYYYAGKTYRALNNFPLAMDFYQKALLKTDTTDKMLLSRISSQLGYVYEHQMLKDESLGMYKKAYAYARQLNDTIGMIYCLRDIGNIYNALNKYTDALNYCKRAMKLASDSHNKELTMTITQELSNVYLTNKQYAKALYYIRPVVEYDDPKNRSSVYSILSDIYTGLGEADSAYICYKKILSMGTVYAKQAAYRGLTDYYMSKGKMTEAVSCLDSCLQLTDSIQNITNTEFTINKKSFFEYRNNQNKIKALQDKNAIQTYIIVIIVLGLLIIVCMIASGIIYVKINRRSFRYKRDKYDALKQDRTEQDNMIRNMDIYRQIFRVINNPQSKKKISEKQWKELSQTINSVYPGFDEKLSDLCKMSQFDYRVCLLLKIKVPSSNIAVMVNLTKSGISSIKTKLFKRSFHTAAKASQWDEIIASL